MARSRNIKPSFFQNEHLADTSPHARLLFIGLWGIADKEGRLEDRPKRIKASLFPYEDIDADKLLNELATSLGRFILRYKIDNNCYIQIINFSKHQTPHVKECASIIPAPDLSDTSISQAPDLSDTSISQAPPFPLTLNPHPSSLNQDTSLSSTKMNDLFMKFWKEYPKKVSKGIAKRAFLKLHPSEELVDRMIQSLKTQKQSEQWLVENGKYITNPATWLNAEKWEDEVMIKNNGHKQEKVSNTMADLERADEERKKSKEAQK